MTVEISETNIDGQSYTTVTATAAEPASESRTDKIRKHFDKLSDDMKYHMIVSYLTHVKCHRVDEWIAWCSDELNAKVLHPDFMAAVKAVMDKVSSNYSVTLGPVRRAFVCTKCNCVPGPTWQPETNFVCPRCGAHVSTMRPEVGVSCVPSVKTERRFLCFRYSITTDQPTTFVELFGTSTVSNKCLKVIATRDKQGVVMWPADTKLEFEDGEWFDSDCRKRGCDIGYDALEMLVGREIDRDSRIDFEVTVLTDVKKGN